MRISTAVFFLFSFLAGLCQENIFTRLTEEDGLPGDQTTCFLKDKNGFIWIGTSSGLCRYDGYEIKSYTKDMGYDISDEYINAIIQDKEGIIWVGTNGGGLNRFDPRTEEFISIRHNPEEPNSIAGDRIRKLVEGDDGIIWIAFDNGLGLSKFDKNTGVSVNYDPFVTVNTAGVKAIRGMVRDLSDPTILWLGTTSGLIRFDITSEQFEIIDHPLSEIDRYGLFALDQIDENRLIGGFFHAGIDIYNIKEDKWEEVYTDPAQQLRIFDLARKSENEFWVAARRKGLATYDIDRRKLTFIPSQLNNQSTPFPGFTRGVYAEDDRVWVGGKYGVSFSNEKKLAFPFDSVSYHKDEIGQLIGFSGKYNKIYLLEFPFKGLIEVDKITGQKVFHTFTDKDRVFYDMLEREEVIYFYDRNRDLYAFHKDSKSLSHIPTPLVRGRKLALRGIKEWTDSHAILLTAYGGTWQLEFASNKVSVLVRTDDNDEWQQDALIHEDGSIWIGGTKGIISFNPENNDVSRLDLKIIDSEEKHVQALARAKDGIIWIGTTRGLVKIDGSEETLYNVQNSGLAGNVIYQIKIDGEGQLWLKTQKGISKVIPSRMEIVNYDGSDGIDPDGKLELIDNEIYYGTYGGYFKLTKQIIRQTEKLPDVHLLSFQVANQDFEMAQTINHMQEVQLEHWENSFSFSFASPNYEHPEKIQYAYRLSGLDETWVANQGRRFANFTNLDGGTYIFQVKARTREGNWGAIKSVTIQLATPFWEAWWFYLLCGVAMFGSGILIYTIRVRTIQRKADLAAQELQIEALKNRFTELHTSPAEIAVQLNFKELNQKLNTQLTLREFEVLKLSLEGKTNSEISDSLSISVSTVKFHLRNTYSKMGVGNRKEAFQYMLNT